MGINTGALYIIFIMLALFGMAYAMSGPTPSQTPNPTGALAVITQAQTNTSKSTLQLYDFPGVTITPPVAGLCTKGGANVHPEVIIGYTPAQANAVSTTGQITLWVSDTKSPYIAPNEDVRKVDGSVRSLGDIGAKGPDNFLMEPSLFVMPETAEIGGKAYFPQYIRGDYNNGTSIGGSDNGDIIPPNSAPLNRFTVEYIWNVSDIGLTDNTYQLEFLVRDGSQQLGVKCFTIRVYTPPEAQNSQNQLPL